MANGNGNGNGLPPQWRGIIGAVQTVGVPVAFLAVIVYWLAFVLMPPIIEGHTQFLKNSVEAQTRIADSVVDIDETLQEIRVDESERKEFMLSVQESHGVQESKLDTIERAVASP